MQWCIQRIWEGNPGGLAGSGWPPWRGRGKIVLVHGLGKDVLVRKLKSKHWTCMFDITDPYALQIDAAEIREEFESLEQQWVSRLLVAELISYFQVLSSLMLFHFGTYCRAYREKVEMVKKQLMDVKAARIARGQKSPAFKGGESSDESSSDDDDDENFAVDWRAKHL